MSFQLWLQTKSWIQEKITYSYIFHTRFKPFFHWHKCHGRAAMLVMAKQMGTKPAYLAATSCWVANPRVKCYMCNRYINIRYIIHIYIYMCVLYLYTIYNINICIFIYYIYIIYNININIYIYIYMYIYICNTCTHTIIYIYTNIGSGWTEQIGQAASQRHRHSQWPLMPSQCSCHPSEVPANLGTFSDSRYLMLLRAPQIVNGPKKTWVMKKWDINDSPTLESINIW